MKTLRTLRKLTSPHAASTIRKPFLRPIIAGFRMTSPGSEWQIIWSALRSPSRNESRLSKIPTAEKLQLACPCNSFVSDCVDRN